MSPNLLPYPRQVLISINGVASETEMFLSPCLWVVTLLTLWNSRGIWRNQESFIHTSKGKTWRKENMNRLGDVVQINSCLYLMKFRQNVKPFFMALSSKHGHHLWSVTVKIMNFPLLLACTVTIPYFWVKPKRDIWNSNNYFNFNYEKHAPIMISQILTSFVNPLPDNSCFLLQLHLNLNPTLLHSVTVNR